jgi:futalosine hydrolase
MKKSSPIGLMAAVPFESRLLRRRIRGVSKITPSLLVGRLGDRRVAYITSGVGIANAAHAATMLIEKFAPPLVVLFGIGGAYPGAGLKIGDLAIAEREVYADTGVLTKDGPRGLEYMGFPLLRRGRKAFYNDFPLEGGPALRLPAGRVKPGVFLTVSQCTGTLRRAQELRRKYRAVCENMEGASVAHTCARYGVPVIELRGISNMVQDRDPEKWDRELAAANCQRAVIEMLGAL